MARDSVPLEIKSVVAVVIALRIRRMRAEWLNHNRIDDEAGQDRPVRIGADDGLVDELLDDDDDAIGGKCRLLLAPEQPPDLRVAGRVGALSVNDRDVGLE